MKKQKPEEVIALAIAREKAKANRPEPPPGSAYFTRDGFVIGTISVPLDDPPPEWVPVIAAVAIREWAQERRIQSRLWMTGNAHAKAMNAVKAMDAWEEWERANVAPERKA